MQKGSWRENVYVNTFFKLKTQVSEIHFEMLFPYICRVDILHTYWEQHNFWIPESNYVGFMVLQLRLARSHNIYFCLILTVCQAFSNEIRLFVESLAFLKAFGKSLPCMHAKTNCQRFKSLDRKRNKRGWYHIRRKSLLKRAAYIL